MSTSITPHGGTLVNLIKSGPEREELLAVAKSAPEIIVGEREISDIEMLAVGAFSPLRGFMNKADYQSVVETMHLAGGAAWSLPITLSIAKADAARIKEGQKAGLRNARGEILALMDVAEIFPYDKENEARKVYRTADDKHPGVAAVFKQGELLVGGAIHVLNRPRHHDFLAHRRDPAETRELFQQRGWKSVVAFQTRNPIHRAHEYITKVALEIVDGLMIHPLVGATKSDDIPAAVRMKCYEALLEHYYPKDRTLLSVFPAAMRYAGPREAIFHALVRKNYGCTHFIVGRDHAGVGNYYGTYDAQHLFREFKPEELGVTPLMFENAFWCKRSNGMATTKTSPSSEAERVSLSGTKVREMLQKGDPLPQEFSRPEVARILQESVRPQAKKGFVLWFTGLSGSGKSTLANAVSGALRERGHHVHILDGDEVRRNLSKGLGFSKEDRDTNVTRIGYVASLVAEAGGVCITAAISPYRDVRAQCRAMAKNFVEVYAEAPIEVCESRDVKGLYAKARAGEIKNFTGVDDPYEAPENPEVTVHTGSEPVEEGVEKILNKLEALGLL
ncbi:MAG: putative bifunctional SAT/APS kinase [Myxococcota bacterium]|nr:putative bifunctional SAT/APS kinase [Myxococcota bacterium]